MPFIENHINSIFDAKGQFGILQKMRNPNNFAEIRDILTEIDPGLLKRCSDFSICNSRQIAPFYWVYKRNYAPWVNLDSFLRFMESFDLLFGAENHPLYCDIPDEMMFSLSIVFYFDRQMHS